MLKDSSGPPRSPAQVKGTITLLCHKYNGWVTIFAGLISVKFIRFEPYFTDLVKNICHIRKNIIIVSCPLDKNNFYICRSLLNSAHNQRLVGIPVKTYEQTQDIYTKIQLPFAQFMYLNVSCMALK